MEDLRQDLRAVTKKCRTDRDITTPELKEAWQQGGKKLFCPYGKTYVQTPGEQVRGSVAIHVHTTGNRRVFGQADQNVEIRRTAMVQTHQPGQTAFRSVLPEDIEGDIE
jgi:hypothetical protein